MDESNAPDDRTAEVLQALIKQLSAKDEADRKRDRTEASNATKVRNLYLGIIGSILAMAGTFVTQYLSPPKVADKADIIDVIKTRRDIVRPGAWTRTDDIKTMAALRQEAHQHRLKLHLRIDKNERKTNRNTDVLAERLKDHMTLKAETDKLEEALNHGTSRSIKDIELQKWRLLRLEGLDK